MRAADPGLTEEDLGVSLRSHAQVIGVAADDLEDVVVDAVSRLVRPTADAVGRRPVAAAERQGRPRRGPAQMARMERRKRPRYRVL